MDVQYFKQLKHILHNGVSKGDRTGTGTKSVFGYQMRFDMHDGFPLSTTKKTHWKSIMHELVWFLRGETNIGYLKENGVSIWDEWADENGDLGPVYGKQWRSWPNPNGDEIDQIKQVIHDIEHNPYSRRHIVTGWNPSVLPDPSKSFAENIANGKQALPPCHLLFQFDVQPIDYIMVDGEYAYHFEGKLRKTGKTKASDLVLLPQNFLNVQLYMRSVDTGLGEPFNIASYAALLHIIAHFTKTQPGVFVLSTGDTHIYNNHIDKIKELLTRDPKKYKLPTIKIAPSLKDIDELEFDDVMIEGYESYPHIKMDISV
ncbi:thymidylate synthase [Chryseobacterium phage MA9V-2]|nr:thymidylate synthase [Chryseobacterium phage MA9V-2]